MEKIFYTKKNTFPSTDDAVFYLLKTFYNIQNPCIKRNENGKPFLDGNKNAYLFFSVSHTDDLLFVAVGNQNVGIDAEKIDREINYLPILKKFSLTERERIRNKQDFISFWTAKESAIKWLGGTIAKTLSKLQYVDGNLYYNGLALPLSLCFFNIENHVVAVCSEVDFSTAEVIPFIV